MYMQHGDMVMGIDMKHSHAALTWRMGIQNGHATWTSSIDMQHLFFCSCTCQLFASVVTIPRINTHMQARSYSSFLTAEEKYTLSCRDKVKKVFGCFISFEKCALTWGGLPGHTDTKPHPLGYHVVAGLPHVIRTGSYRPPLVSSTPCWVPTQMHYMNLKKTASSHHIFLAVCYANVHDA
jgi:hypothetical protein